LLLFFKKEGLRFVCFGKEKMDFQFSDDQRLLKDSVDRLIGPAYDDLGHRKKMQATELGYDEALWAKYAELGLLALPFSEEEGGFGGGTVETMIVMEAVGKGLALEPFFASIILGGNLVRLGASAETRAELIPQIADGSARLAFAHTERQARYDLHDVTTMARKTGGGYVLEGDKSVVLHGDSATKLIVSARTSGGHRDRDGITLFLVDPSTAGVSRRGFPTQDGLRGAAVSLGSVEVPESAIIGTLDHGAELIDQVSDIAIAAICAEAVGNMAALHELTLDYLKTRKQFGVTIGSFQVLQHRAVDMFTALEQARSMEYFAAMMAGAVTPKERRAAVSAAKVQINNSAHFLGQAAIQMHGGIGITMEYRAGHYFKRLTMIESAFGDTDHHMRLIDQAGGLLEAA
jgi:pimeloyl-CoA dehydrogenase small subunit